MPNTRIVDLCSKARNATFFVTHTIDINGTAVDVHFFVATQRCIVKGIKAIPRVLNTAAVTATITRCQGTEAPTNGDLMHSGSINLNSGVDTVQTLTLISSESIRTLEVGNRLSVDLSGALTAAVCQVTAEMALIA